MPLLTRRNLLIGFLILLVLVALTFPLWRPLIVNDVVNEPFPGAGAALMPTFEALEQPQQDAFTGMATEDPAMAATMVSAFTAPDQVVPEAEQAMPAMADPVILSLGSFGRIDAIHAAEGTATIYHLADGGRILRFEDFRATNGPDLHVYLSRHEAPRNHADLGADYVDLGQLKGNVGNQNYDIPADLDLTGYNSVVIYCVPFQVVFSTATLAAS